MAPHCRQTTEKCAFGMQESFSECMYSITLPFRIVIFLGTGVWHEIVRCVLMGTTWDKIDEHYFGPNVGITHT